MIFTRDYDRELIVINFLNPIQHQDCQTKHISNTKFLKFIHCRIKLYSNSSNHHH